MDSFYRSLRRGTLVTIALCSMLGGLVLVWHLLRPGVINLVPTAQLVILLGLFVLPAITVGAWALDLKHVRAAAAPRDASADSALSDVLADGQTEPASITHGHAPGRDAAGTIHRHRRAGEPAAPSREGVRQPE